MNMTVRNSSSDSVQRVVLDDSSWLSPFLLSSSSLDGVALGLMLVDVGRAAYRKCGLDWKNYRALMAVWVVMDITKNEFITRGGVLSCANVLGFVGSAAALDGHFKALIHSKYLEFSHKRNLTVYYRFTPLALSRLDVLKGLINYRLNKRAAILRTIEEKRPAFWFKIQCAPSPEFLEYNHPVYSRRGPIPEDFDGCAQL